jgi:hypothetical protein
MPPRSSQILKMFFIYKTYKKVQQPALLFSAFNHGFRLKNLRSANHHTPQGENHGFKKTNPG